MKTSALKIVLTAAVISMACTTKVSEWFLLNAAPDKYLLVYNHNGNISEKETKQNQELGVQAEKSNFLFRTQRNEGLNQSYYALYYNNRLLTEYRNNEALSAVITSPLRKKIADELMEGQLCVMLFLKTGKPEKDEKRLDAVKNAISSSPFRDVITLVELDRNSLEEKYFVSMILQVEDDLKGINEPMLFGIFGRFRALEPLLANGISEENIRLMIDFLTADCSCLIKDNLPGMSILCEASWENPGPALVNRILDENPGLIHH